MGVLERATVQACAEHTFSVHNRAGRGQLLEIDLSTWLGFLTPAFLDEATAGFKSVKLTLRRVQGLDMKAATMLAEAVGSRVTELEVDDCALLSWSGELRKLLASTKALEVLVLRKNRWLDDLVLEQVGVRWHRSLMRLELEDAPLVSNNGLFQLGRRCALLTVLSLVCCPKVSDMGLEEVAKKAHLSSLTLSHNLKVTDKGAERLLSSGRALSQLVLTNCPKLTDKTVGCLYEATASWGAKRNTESAQLTHLELRDNSLFTAELLLWVSACLPALRSLDLRDCDGVDLVKGMGHILSMHLTHLRLGPTSQPLDSVRFTAAMQYQAPQLRVLYLAGLPLLDEHLGELLENALGLEELSLVDVQFGTATVEALASSVPNIDKLLLCGSGALRDADVRCLSMICRHITELTLQRCPRLTDSAFTRFPSLTLLRKLDVADCSRGVLTGGVLKFLTLAPLQELALDGMLLEGTPLLCLHAGTHTSLTSLSLRRCPLLSAADLPYILQTFVGLRSLDCSDCLDLPAPDTLRVAPNPAPFLRYSYSSEVSGFSLSPEDAPRYWRFWQLQRHLRRHYGARLLQRLRRRYLLRLVDLKEGRKEGWQLFKHERATVVQAALRGFLGRRVCSKKKLTSLLLVRVLKTAALRWLHIKSRRAQLHYRRTLKGRVWAWLKRHVSQSRSEFARLAALTATSQLTRIVRVYWVVLLRMRQEFRDLHYEDCAAAFHEVRFLQRILQHWRTVVHETCLRNQRLVRQLMACVELSAHNSRRQLAARLLAAHFNQRRVLMTAWLCFARDYLSLKRVNALVPMALQHAKWSFFQRQVRSVFRGIDAHRVTRLLKRAAKRIADKHALFFLQLLGGRGMWRRLRQIQLARATMRRSGSTRRDYLLRISFRTRLPTLVRHSKHFKTRAREADLHIRERRVALGWDLFKVRTIESKLWRMVIKRAEHLRARIYNKHTFAAWCEFKKYSRNLGAFLYLKYLKGWQRKILYALRLNVRMSKDYVMALTVELEERSGDKDVMVRVLLMVVKLQARARATQAKVRFDEVRISKLYSLQVLQNFFRTCLARKDFGGRLRKADIGDKVREGAETELMRESDAETSYYNYQIRAITSYQRIFRGWKGRIAALAMAYLQQREGSIAYYEKNHHNRLHHEAFKRAAQAREHLKGKSVVVIQKVARGRIGRRRFRDCKHAARTVQYAVYVQRDYRRRLAQKQLQALKRDKKAELRFKAARRQRGLMMRLLGFKTRKTQSQLAKVLEGLGLDPLSFNYRIGELWRETKEDFWHFLEVMRREKALLEENGINRLANSIGRRKVLTEQGCKLQLLDAVRIVEEMHPYCGYTGIISRIDETLLGLPLFEVKLDRVKRQTFVRMTVDVFSTYATHQPLKKITLVPLLDDWAPANVIFGVQSGDKADDPFYGKARVDAAWTVQRGFRVFRAKKIVSRKRYEVWLQSAARQWSLLNHLAETNSVNTQAYNVAGLLSLRPKKNIFYDEVRHPFQPGRLASSVRKETEAVSIGREVEVKFRDRVAYLQKCAITQGIEYFSTGYERLTFRRKFTIFGQIAYGLVFKKRQEKGQEKGKGGRLQDVRGSQGIRVLANQKSLVTGTDRYCFSQFDGSPHVRYARISLFQGEWSGVPLFSPLKPHGSGVVMFLDGWGFAKEDKVLYLTVVRCRYLNAMDLSSSDPYCEIHCNGMMLQSSVKWSNLNPEYHEAFEIDVTNPGASLNVVVKDKDYFGSDDFMGQIVLELSEFADGLEHEGIYQLLGEDVKEKEDGDRGEITLKLRWAERKFEDDQAKEALQLSKLIKLQSWVRRIQGLVVLKNMRALRVGRMKLVKEKAVKITNTCRIRLARKELRRRNRHRKAAIKLQKRVRIWIAKKVFKLKKLRHMTAIIIQAQMRVFLAKARVARIKAKISADLDAVVTVIQKNARRMVVRCRDRVRRKEERRRRAAEDEDETREREAREIREGKRQTVAEWLPFYGRDPEYGLRRNRRMTERLFRRMLKLPFVRLQTRLGTVYMDSWPPRRSEEEQALEMQGVTAQTLTVREDFVSTFLPPFNPRGVHRKEAKELCQSFPHLAVLHLPSSVQMRASVDYNVSTVQCLVRQTQARRMREKRIRVHHAIALFQRIFRRRYEKFTKASIKITCLFRTIGAKALTALLRKERNAANTVEMAFRCYRARSCMFDLRCVGELLVLKSIPGYVALHGPEKALEHRSDTFWIAETNERAELRVEFKKQETITEIWIMTSTYSQSPEFVTISAVVGKERTYTELAYKESLPLLKQHRWHKFAIPFTVTKYFRLVFHDNHGDEHQISVRQVRFLRSIEKSATILKEPLQYILERGPSIGKEGQLTLKVEAMGWPAPTYQWFRGGHPIPGANKPELNLTLSCAAYGQRAYRCIKCKMVSTTVPYNAYHIRCGNCSQLFNYKDIEPYDHKVEKVVEQEAVLLQEKHSIVASRLQVESFGNTEKYGVVIEELSERIRKLEHQLQKLREVRIEIKDEAQHCNRFTDEGVYYCFVQNYRGGSMRIRRRSVGAVVVVQHSVPYTVEVAPTYAPRKQGRRKKWSVYASIQGTFRRGFLDGLCVVRYNDGSFYEGPYVAEEAIDSLGMTVPEARPAGHYGMYQAADGRLFEGGNVDNHFDPHNLNAFYRLTLPLGKGVYEGLFCDESYHGTGMFVYQDGSVYEGNWFRGTRFGQGHYRSAEGWTYEGFFDTDRRHRLGVINWADGSCYMGEWYYEQVKGRGVFITPLRDVYKGEMLNGHFHGYGELLYADGSRYLGHFQAGVRHGKGVFTERGGDEYYGQFREDERQGEHVCKVVITVEEQGQDNFEVRVGLFDKGRFVKWLSKFSNPIATRQFVQLFRKNREMFDSVFSMLLAKNLPALPEGIDSNNAAVKGIVFKIRSEAGMLVGEAALNHAQAQLSKLLKPVEEKNKVITQLKREVEAMSVQKIDLDRDAFHYYYKFDSLIGKFEKDTQKIEQYWVDEPTEVRAVFNEACKMLKTVSVDEFFSFRNHRVVPPFVKKILDAVSILIGIPLEWASQQFIIADAVANSRNGDEEALRHHYHCKLSHMMESYPMYDYMFIKEFDTLMDIFADTRFRRDSYYVQSTGRPGPILVDWVKSNYAYIRAAKLKYPILHAAEQTRLEAFRYKAIHARKSEEAAELDKKLAHTQGLLTQANREVEELQHALLKANDLLEFISGRYAFGQGEGKQDYYKQLEQKMEEKRDLFTIEVALAGLIGGVEAIADKQKAQRIIQVLASGQKWVEPVEEKPQIADWILEEVLAQQQTILEHGDTLGYSFEAEASDVTYAYTDQLVSLIIDIVTGKLNDLLNDQAEARSWLSRKGRRISSRFLYVLTWKCWETEALRLRDAAACQAWGDIFGSDDACARMALEARISERMSKIAREQAKVWAKAFPQAVGEAEEALAGEFEAQYESPEQTAREAEGVLADESGDVSPTTKASCAAWMRLHPAEMSAARDEQNQYSAQLFADQFPDGTAEVCFKVLNGWGNAEEMEWVELADHWKSFNMEIYDAAAGPLLKEMAGDFEEAFPVSTFLEVARVLEQSAVHDWIEDAEVALEYAVPPRDLLNANCWAVLNQGMVRKGREKMQAESEVSLSKQWAELLAVSDQFRKGSALLSGGDEVDRFVGFRSRLANKHAWLLGYIGLQQSVVTQQLVDLTNVDPLDKVLHRVRPSQLEQVRRQKEDEFMATQRALEARLEGLQGKLASWNTYFGRGQTSTYYEGYE